MSGVLESVSMQSMGNIGRGGNSALMLFAVVMVIFVVGIILHARTYR